ncbi:putative ribonuclease H-like domain-containing protein [Tanacetum coccineum]
MKKLVRRNLVRGRTPLIDFMKPFGCLVTILNTRDQLGKFDRKADEVSEEDAKEKTTKIDKRGASNKDGKDDQATRSEFERLPQQEKHIVHPNSTNSIIKQLVHPMDVKSAFLYGTIEEEVYVCQPPGFEDLHFPDKVYKDKRYILLVQVYVDDIIFGSTKKTLCLDFEQMMHKRFQMSSIGELTFFLGLQVQQKENGIFISQDKYVADILKKFDYVTVKTTSTPMEFNKALVKDEEADNVDVHLYRSMIRSLMYLTASRPDITFVVCACARESPFDLEAFSDSDYVGVSLDRKSTTGVAISIVCLGTGVLSGFASSMEVVGEGVFVVGLVWDGRMRSCGPPEKVDDKVVHKELGDRMERVATTASSLEAEQDNGNINRTQSMATLNEPSP